MDYYWFLTILYHHNHHYWMIIAHIISYHNHQNWSFLSSVWILEDHRPTTPHRRVGRRAGPRVKPGQTHRATWKAAGPREVGIEKHRKKHGQKYGHRKNIRFFFMEKCGRTMEHHRNLLGKSVEHVGNPQKSGENYGNDQNLYKWRW